MEIKIRLEPIQKEFFEDLDKQLTNVYSNLDIVQQISAKKQILAIKDAQYALELSLIQLTTALTTSGVKEKEVEVINSDPQTEELQKKVVEENSVDIEL